MKQNPAKIFLAEKQAIKEDGKARTASVFSGANGWFGNLYVLNDETLAPGFSLKTKTDDGILLIVPIVGDLVISNNSAEQTLACGEVMLVEGAGGKNITITNPYEDELVNFLQIRMHVNPSRPSVSKCAFDLNKAENELVTLIVKDSMRLCLGKFAMRREAEFYTSRQGTGVFFFVLQGSFEIEGRLLHHRDALAIWGTKNIDIESLGKESILLLVEVPVR